MTSALGGREGYRGGFTSSLRGSRSFPKVFQHCGGRDLDLGGTKVSMLLSSLSGSSVPYRCAIVVSFKMH
jgi:hypothetical protein